MSDRLNRLAQLAHMIKETELARLSKAEEARRRINEERAAIRAAQYSEVSGTEPDLASFSGAAERWQRWSQNRLKQLSAQEAIAAAEAEAQKRVAARAFGRSSVLSGLELRDLMERKRKRR